MNEAVRVVLYLNQFFAGLGGEEEADLTPQWLDDARGPGKLLQQIAPQFELVGTLVAGDNYVAENLDTATKSILNIEPRQILGIQFLPWRYLNTFDT